MTFKIPSEQTLHLETKRLTLEPILESHAEEMWELFRDPELHHFVPFEPLSLENSVNDVSSGLGEFPRIKMSFGSIGLAETSPLVG